MKSYVGVNPKGRSTEKVKLLLNSSNLEPQPARSQHHRGDDGLELVETLTRRAKSHFLTCQMSK
jgi:hypothetical protein